MNDKEMLEVNKAFDRMSTNENDEQLTKEELKDALRALGFEPRTEEVNTLMKEYGNRRKLISRAGFHKIMTAKYEATRQGYTAEPSARGRRSKKSSSLPEEISKVFQLLDLDKKGVLTVDSLRKIAQELNEPYTDEELQEMIVEADTDGDGQINETEFFDIMKRTGLY